MPTHRFKIGQDVRVKRSLGHSPATPGSFRITAMLPERNNSPQYRMRSDAERHERVMVEDELELINASPAPAILEFQQ